jgi:hypothetical protein
MSFISTYCIQYKIDLLILCLLLSNKMSTMTDKVMTRSETAKIKKNVEDIRSFIESHRRDGVTDERWDHIFHNWKCLGMSTEESDDEDSYQQPCRCCIARMFRT